MVQRFFYPYFFRMKTALFLIFAFLVGTAFVPKTDLTLKWKSTERLAWKDFKGRAPLNSSFKAMTTTKIGIDIEFEEDRIVVDLPTYFVKNKSWTKHKKGATELLAHEELHFDLTESMARNLRAKVAAIEERDMEKFYAEVQKLYDKNFEELSELQDKYDEDTEHGIKLKEQAVWTNIVMTTLNKLKDYEDSKVVLPLAN